MPYRLLLDGYVEHVVGHRLENYGTMLPRRRLHVFHQIQHCVLHRSTASDLHREFLLDGFETEPTPVLSVKLAGLFVDFLMCFAVLALPGVRLTRLLPCFTFVTSRHSTSRCLAPE